MELGSALRIFFLNFLVSFLQVWSDDHPIVDTYADCAVNKSSSRL